MKFYKPFLSKKKKKKIRQLFADKNNPQLFKLFLDFISSKFCWRSSKKWNSFHPFYQIPQTKYFWFKYAMIICFIICIMKYFFDNNEILNTSKLFPIDAFFIRPEIAKDLDCAGFFEPRNISFSKINMKWGVYELERIKFKTPDNLSMACKDIFSRHYFPSKPLSDAEKDFPIAFARIVYTDYYFLEMELAGTYQPQNFYCFSIDKKSSKNFHDQIHNLSKCFSNVFYTKQEYSVSAGGRHMNEAHFECLKLLNEFNWKYVVLLQNHDFGLKTNAEMIQIFQWLNGTNDVELRRLPERRVDKSYNYTFKDLKLFKNETRNTLSFNGFSPELTFAKGYVEVSLTKAMVAFMINELDLTELFIRLNKRGFGVDEILIPTLQATEALNAPGGFFHRCIGKAGGNMHFSRKSSWNGAMCQSKLFRHGMCVYGLEDLIVLDDFPHLFANKMMQSVDFGAYICWRERMFRRTFNFPRLDPSKTLNATVYLEHPAVRYNRKKYLPDFDSAQFRC